MFFDSEESAAEAHEKFEDFAKKGNTSSEGYFDIDISSIKHEGRSMKFFCQSTRIPNLQWQQEEILAFAKQLEGIEEVSMPLMVQEDGICWFAADEEEELV